MPAEALAVPHGVTMAATLPSGVAGFTLTFGTYEEASFIGMTIKVRLSEPMVDLATGDVLQVTWTATVGPDGTATITGLPYNDDPALYPTSTGYYAEWQALSYKATPGNKNFAILRSAGPTVDYDLIGTPGYIPIWTAPVGLAHVGFTVVG